MLGPMQNALRNFPSFHPHNNLSTLLTLHEEQGIQSLVIHLISIFWTLIICQALCQVLGLQKRMRSSPSWRLHSISKQEMGFLERSQTANQIHLSL